MRALHRIYDPLLDCSLRRPEIAISFRAVVIVACVRLFPLLGGEFMPKLEEGNFWIRATLPMCISLDAERQVHRPTMRASSAAVPKTRTSPAPRRTAKHPEVVTGRLAARPPRRRHRRRRLLQHRALRAAEAVRRVAARLTKDKLTDELNDELATGVPRRRLQLLADDRRQRRGGAVAASRARTRSRCSAPTSREREERRRHRRRASPTSTASRPRHVHARSASPTSRSSPDRRRCARYGLNTRRRRRRHPDGDRRRRRSRRCTRARRRFDLTVRWLEPYRDVARGDPRDPRSPTPDGADDPARRSSRTSSCSKGPSIIYPRGRRALRAGEVLGARPRPRDHGQRGAAADRARQVHRTLRHAPRVGRRRSTSSSEAAARLAAHRPAHAAADRAPGLHRGEDAGSTRSSC